MIDVGSEVICIDDSIGPQYLLKTVEIYPNWLKKGKKYTVKSIYVFGNLTGITLEELSNPERDDIIKGMIMEPGFDIRRFREVIDDLMEKIDEIEKGFSQEELIETFAYGND